MITQTSELAIKAMTYLVLTSSGEPISPKQIADAMGCSQTYLSKIMGLLTKAGLLEARRGALGGVVVAQAPERITMLAIVEACQGLMIGNYCRAIGDDLGPVCGFHQAMLDVHLSTKLALARWTLKDLAARPEPTGPLAGNGQCRMSFMQTALNAGQGPERQTKSESD